MEKEPLSLEKLNKSQIVLLTLLVSFMTSIATGIVTVSLMEDAPPVITETVNRIVERTVERVVPGQAAAVAQTQTIVVKESSLIAESINAVAPSIVRLHLAGETPTFLGLGFVLDSTGTIVTDAAALGEITHADIVLSDGSHVKGTIHSKDQASGLAYISVSTSTVEGKAVVWQPARLATEKTVLGQTVVVLSGKDATRINQGLIIAISALSADTEDADLVLETNIPKDGILLGSPIIDTDGNILGVSTSVSRTSDASGFISASALMAQSESIENKNTSVIQ